MASLAGVSLCCVIGFFSDSFRLQHRSLPLPGAACGAVFIDILAVEMGAVFIDILAVE